MEYGIPLCHTAEIFLTVTIPTYSHQLNLTLKTTPLVNSFALHIDAKWQQANIHNVAFDKHHLSQDQLQDLFNVSSKHKKIWLSRSLSTQKGSHWTKTWS